MFGCYSPPVQGVEFACIHTPPRRESRVYFNTCDSLPDKEIKYLAFEDISHPAVRPYPESLVPASPFSGTQYNEPWFFSSCSLKGVIEITLCRSSSLSYTPISGMLVQYTDGHRACLGQLRFDWALETVHMEQNTGLYIGSGRTRKRFAYVAEVTAHPPSDRSKLSWMDVHWDEILEWWFSSRHSIVRHFRFKSARR